MKEKPGLANAPNWIIALATVVLVVITGRYAWLTNKLVRLQVRPSIECGINAFDRDKLFLRNLSGEPASAVKVAWTDYVFDDPNRPPSSAYFSLDWWDVPRIVPGQTLTKDLSEALASIARNEDIERQMQERRAKQLGQKPLGFVSRVLFTVTYQRQVDGSVFSSTCSATVRKDANTGKPFIQPDVPSYMPKTLEDLKK